MGYVNETTFSHSTGSSSSFSAPTLEEFQTMSASNSQESSSQSSTNSVTTRELQTDFEMDSLDEKIMNARKEDYSLWHSSVESESQSNIESGLGSLDSDVWCDRYAVLDGKDK